MAWRGVGVIVRYKRITTIDMGLWDPLLPLLDAVFVDDWMRMGMCVWYDCEQQTTARKRKTRQEA